MSGRPEPIPAPLSERPELPAGAETQPRWPAWYAAVGFVVALFATGIAVAVVAALTGTETGDENTSATFTIGATFAQSAIFVAVAVGFAALAERPRLWHFGLRPTAFWPAVGWATLGMVCFYVFAGVYSALVKPDVDQGVTKALGADQGTLGLIAAGLMVMVVAPVAEEFFFRGFFFRSLRNRMPLLVAALLAGALFGAIHWDFSSADSLLIVPPLAVLGFVFCLVYERTGSLFPCIALHAFNNSVAFAAQADNGALVSLAVGPLMIAACALAPRLVPRGPTTRAPAAG